jgi:hypothetical protein
MTELEGLVKTMSGDQRTAAQARLSRWLASSERSEPLLAQAAG